MDNGNAHRYLFSAVRASDISSLVDYIESGGDLNVVEEGTGDVPLCIAAENGDVTAGQLLLDSGADPNVASHAWPVHFAAGNGHAEFVELLLEYDSEVHCLDEEGGTPLMDAAAGGHLAVVEMLLEAGSDPTHRDRH